MKKTLFCLIFFMSVFFKIALNRRVLFISLFLFPVFVVIFLMLNNLSFISFFCLYLISVVLYFVNQSRKYWQTIKENRIIKAKVVKFYSEKRRTKGRSYFVNLMNYEFRFKDKTIQSNDFALMKIIKDKDKMWDFDREAVKNGLTQKEFESNYEKDFEIFISSKNPNIHIFKNYNLHQIYLKTL